MEYSQIEYKKQGEITIITFNRPEVMNCIGPVTHRELVDAWGRFKTDDSAKAAVLTGTGDHAFCTGGDLKHGPEIVSMDPAEVAAHCRGERPGHGAHHHRKGHQRRRGLSHRACKRDRAQRQVP